MKPFVRDNIRNVLGGRKILLGVSGSIAAFKAHDIVRWLRDCGAEVRVVLTESGEKFVTPVTMETLSGQPVLSSLWEHPGGRAEASESARRPHGIHHIDSARWADLVLIAPATANTIGKLALGLADDLLSTELLAFKGPVLIAPAMNPAMYAHPAVQDNIATLLKRDCTILGPAVGITSCGEEGLGRMVEPDEIVEAVAEKFHAPATGKHFIITLGPTRSALDPVRYLTNRSSGLMGAALCWAALERGHRVTAVCGPHDAPLPRARSRFHVRPVTTAREMAHEVDLLLPSADVFIAAAAVLDWDVRNPVTSKLKKEAGAPDLKFEANPDILRTAAARRRPGQLVIGFAAETDDPAGNASRKLQDKGCDAIFANDVSRADAGFESDRNGGWWITPTTATEFATESKTSLARKLLDLVEKQSTQPPRPASRALQRERPRELHP